MTVFGSRLVVLYLYFLGKVEVRDESNELSSSDEYFLDDFGYLSSGSCEVEGPDEFLWSENDDMLLLSEYLSFSDFGDFLRIGTMSSSPYRL